MTDEQKEEERMANQERVRRIRENETEEEREKRNLENRERRRQREEEEGIEERAARTEANTTSHRINYSAGVFLIEIHSLNIVTSHFLMISEAQRQARVRRRSLPLSNAVPHYLGAMDKECTNCKALFFSGMLLCAMICDTMLCEPEMRIP